MHRLRTSLRAAVRSSPTLPTSIFALFFLASAYTSASGEDRPRPVSTADTDIVINEVFYLGNSAAEDWIELKNLGTMSIDVSTWIFCARFNYSFSGIGSLTLLDGASYTIDPGKIIRVQSWTDLNNISSDLGLYIDTNFGSASSMVDFVQWGTSADVGRTDVAFAKGIWTRISAGVYDWVDTATGTDALAYSGVNGGGGLLTLSSDWGNQPPTPGGENAPIAASESTWGQIKELFRD